MRATSRRPSARKNSPAFRWGFLHGFLIDSRRRSECFRASVLARFLVMAKNGGGYFSITNFLTVSHGLRGCLLFRFASLLIVCHSRAVLAVSAAFCCAGWVFACPRLFRALCGCFCPFCAVSRLLCCPVFACGAIFCPLWRVWVVGRMFSRPRCFRAFTGVLWRSAVVLLIA